MDEIHDLIKNNTTEAQQLVLDLCKLIERLVPTAKQKIYRGWGVIDYQLGGSRDFISIGPQKKYVNLYFMHGIMLSDPWHLLEGSGKNMRHIKIRSKQDINNPRYHKLIKDAEKIYLFLITQQSDHKIGF